MGIIVGVTLTTWLIAATMITLVKPYQWIAVGPVLLFEVPLRCPVCRVFRVGALRVPATVVRRSALVWRKRYWVVACVITLIAYQSWVQYIFNHPELMESRRIAVGMWLVRLILCGQSCLVLILIFGMRYLNRPHAIHRHLAHNSYRMYLLHPAVVVWVQLAFWCRPNLDWLTTFIGTGMLSLLVTCLVSVLIGLAWHWCVRRFPALVQRVCRTEDPIQS